MKRSDLRMLFGHVDQQNPLYLHVGDERNRIVKGLNVDLLKAPALLCAPCNNARSAPYDKAWQTLSAYLHSRRDTPISRVDLKKVYPPGTRATGATYRDMGGLALLYLLKVLGTRLAGEKPGHPLLPTFAEALRIGVPHPQVYVVIKSDVDAAKTLAAASTDFHSLENADDVPMMTWGYSIARWFYQVTYARHRAMMKRGAWHPSDQGRFIEVRPF